MPDLKTPRILWAALCTASVVFLVIVRVVPSGATAPPEPMLAVGLALAALADAAASFIIPAMSLKRALEAARAEVVEQAVSDPNSVIPYRDAPKQRVFANPKAAMRTALLAYQAPFILSLALSESIAIFGFVLGFLGHPLLTYLPFFVIAWVLLLLRFPTRDRVLGQFERAKGAVFP